MYPNHTREPPPRLTPEGERDTNPPKGIKQRGQSQSVKAKRKIIRSIGIKRAYNPFHGPVHNHPSTNQLVLNRYLTRFRSHYPCKISCKKVR